MKFGKTEHPSRGGKDMIGTHGIIGVRRRFHLCLLAGGERVVTVDGLTFRLDEHQKGKKNIRRERSKKLT